MDIKRPAKSKLKKKIRNAVMIVVGLAAIGGITFGLTKLKPAAPTLDRSTAVIGTVKRGEMVREVRGSGTLVPQLVRWVPAPSDGRVERIPVQAGVVVGYDTVIAELSNPKKEQATGLKVRAGTSGVLQEVSVQVGQQVTPGFNIARVADPASLKAELKIAETQIKDVKLGQKVAVDTRNGIIEGQVLRIDPAAREGTFVVDVQLTGPIPASARPDLSVDGTIELERLENVLYMGRPAFGQGQQTVGLFRLSPDGQEALRTSVTLGRNSVSTIEIVNGLREGDQVILSDTSAMDSYNRIRVR